jgi:Tol biopolymer transport system component
LTLSRAAATIVIGGFDSLAAVARDSTGYVARVPVEWSSADPDVASIGKTDGVLLGIAAGTTTITATAGPVSASLTVTVIAVSSSLSVARWTQVGGIDWVSDVLTFSATSTQMRPVKRDTRFASIAAPSWSADGSSLAIEVIHDVQYDDHEHSMDYRSDVYLLQGASLDSSSWRALTTDGLSKAPSWSPDGERIAYLRQSAVFSGNDIYVTNVAGGQPVRVTARTGGYSAPHWSPDGTRLVFSAFDEQLRNAEVFIVNPDGSGLTNASRHSSADYDPSWSPDGSQLVFVSSRDASAGTPAAVYVMDVDGANVRRLTSRSDYSSSPAWSPDGRQIAFLAAGALFVMNSDGSSLAEVTRPPAMSWDASPTWRRLQ